MSDAVQPSGRTWRNLFWRAARLVVLIYCGLLITLYFLQQRLVFPGAAAQQETAARVDTLPFTELVELNTASGVRMAALFSPALDADGRKAPDTAKRPTLLFCYGNAMCLRDSADVLDQFRRLGANVIIPEYPGYGASSGRPSEQGCYEAADAAYEHLLTRKDIDPRRIIVCGWSLGGAVAIDVARRKKPAGLAVFSTFTSLADMGNHTYPFYPAAVLKLILNSKFESEQKMREIACPLLIGHSRKDSIIPFTMADRLEKASGRTAARVTLEKADHNDFFVLGGEKVNAALSSFMNAVAADAAVKDALNIFNEPPPKRNDAKE